MRRFTFKAALFALTSLAAPAAQADEAFVQAFQSHLAAAQLDAAETLARDRVSADPADAQAHFALGTAQFLQAVEGLGQGLYDHGLTQYQQLPAYVPGINDLPFLRMPVATNPHPAPFSAEVMRQILVDFDAALLRAEATLAKVPKGPVGLPLDVRRIAFDYDRDGKAGQQEDFPKLITAISGVGLSEGFPVVGFDESDVTWLRGYAHLLAGITDILLAHDFSEAVNLTFQSAFPGSTLEGSPLNALRGPLLKEYEANLRPDRSCWGGDRSETDKLRQQRCYKAQNALEFGSIGDVIAFIHLFRWPVLEPDRLLTARQHFLTMIALSRESWASILAETDDAAEWVPGPKQTSLFERFRVDDRIVAGWTSFLDQAEGVLEGRLLLPHWRFPSTQGVNLRRMFEEPRTLDPIMIVTGAGAIPYIETGEIAAGSTLDTGMGLLEGGLLAYFLWFN
jgi:hypothetical protein